MHLLLILRHLFRVHERVSLGKDKNILSHSYLLFFPIKLIDNHKHKQEHNIRKQLYIRGGTWRNE